MSFQFYFFKLLINGKIVACMLLNIKAIDCSIKPLFYSTNNIHKNVDE